MAAGTERAQGRRRPRAKSPGGGEIRDDPGHIARGTPQGRARRRDRGRFRAVAAVLVAVMVGGGAVADVSSGRGPGTDAATKLTTVLAVVALVATALAVTRVPRALPFAGAFAGLSWMVALSADADRWWPATVGGLGVVLLLLIAAPTEAMLDKGLRRQVVVDRTQALIVGVVGAGVATAIADTGDPSAVATGAWVAVAAVVALAAVLRFLFRRTAR